MDASAKKASHVMMKIIALKLINAKTCHEVFPWLSLGTVNLSTFAKGVLIEDIKANKLPN